MSLFHDEARTEEAFEACLWRIDKRRARNKEARHPQGFSVRGRVLSEIQKVVWSIGICRAMNTDDSPGKLP